ncbi:MAG: EVE domain-containing protein [Saprospiraceae bacterium]|nr:EVE domain-containing protein [Saprospiraceae bacterium]
MQYWLVKSEPDDYSFDQLRQDGRTAWDGIRNYQARNYLRDMALGDLVLYYHSRTGLEIVGVARVVRVAYPDPTATKGDWSVVDLVPVKPLTTSVSLKTIKSIPALAEIQLVKNSRLSVMPIPKEAFHLILQLGNTQT